MLIEHLESNLGEIEQGWKDNNTNFDAQVVSFTDQPFLGVRTYSTIGLSQVPLAMSANFIRQELIFSAYERFEGSQIASFLLTFAERIADEQKALLQGDVIGPSAPIIFGTLLDSLFVTVPMMFKEEFRVYYGLDLPTVFAWLVPIHESEANFARKEGWKKLDREFETINPDVWDLHRAPIL